MADDNRIRCTSCGICLSDPGQIPEALMCEYCLKAQALREEHRASWVTYMDVEAMKKMEPGLYLGLYHGYKNEEERLDADDWGANGPCIGPLVYAHTTYTYHIKLRFKDDETAKKFGYQYADDFNEIKIKGDVLAYDGMEYGDWTCFVHPTPEVK